MCTMTWRFDRLADRYRQSTRMSWGVGQQVEPHPGMLPSVVVGRPNVPGAAACLLLVKELMSKSVECCAPGPERRSSRVSIIPH